MTAAEIFAAWDELFSGNPPLKWTVHNGWQWPRELQGTTSGWDSGLKQSLTTPGGPEPSFSWHGLPIDGMTREQLLVIVKQLMRPRPLETQSRNEG